MVSPIQFIKESYQEFKKVQWPTRPQTIRLTAYVVGVSLAVGLLISGADYVFKTLLETLIK